MSLAQNFSVVSVSPDSYLEELVSTARSSKVLFPPPRVQMIPQMCNQIIHLPNRALQIPSTCDSAVWTNIVHKSKLLVCLHKIRISQRSYRKGNARHHHNKQRPPIGTTRFSDFPSLAVINRTASCGCTRILIPISSTSVV